MVSTAFLTLAITLFSGALAWADTSAELGDNKQLLIKQVQQWVAEQEQIAASQVEVAAMDRRLRVPSCTSPLEISFPYASSNQTILAKCPNSRWKVFVGVKIHSLIEGYAFARDMEGNQPLAPADIMLIKLDRPAKGLMPGLENLARSDKNYSLTTSVKAGELVAKRHLIESTQVFRLTRDVLAGEPIGQSDIARDNLGLTMTSPNQRFPERLLAQAVATRDLAKGQILSRRDFSVKHMVMTTTSKLSRGQKLSAANTQLKEFYGRLPDDALLLISDIVQMETIRPIRAGQMLRLSDLKPAAMINKGDSVTLTVEAGLLSVSVAMIALESGKIDQQISLLNPESNETVRALVIGPGQARGL